MSLIFYLFGMFMLRSTYAWDSEQLEVFDVVEEVKENFYVLLNISKDASNQEVKSAFRSLSLKLHPDKNLDIDTSEQFRNLVSVYDILRSPTKRKYYDEVLINGLPNWKSAMYYYRYVRKMGMTEVCVILFVIVTIGQYFVHWAAYFERKYTIQENMKKRKQSKKGNTKLDIEIDIPKPSFADTLPVQIPRLIWFILVSIPSTLVILKTVATEQFKEAVRAPTPEPEPEPPKPKTVRKRNKFVVPEGPNFEIKSVDSTTNSNNNQTSAPLPMSGGLWTDDDLEELIRLVKKFPQGSAKRWESIADALGRSVPEVTYMANKMKENGYRMPSEKEEDVPQIKVKQKTKKELDSGENVKNWNQTQQKALEEALSKYPKGCAERWERISDCVPGKTKEECILRFRYLAESLKKQKESVMSESQENENE